jgi:hypothetical protein
MLRTIISDLFDALAALSVLAAVIVGAIAMGVL